MALLTKDQILQADDLKTEDVDVPEWGGTVRVRMLTNEEGDRWEESFVNARKNGAISLRQVKARLVALTAVDDDGKRLFTDAEIPAVDGKCRAGVDRCWQVSQRLNHVLEADAEEMAGNSRSSQSAGSG